MQKQQTLNLEITEQEGVAQNHKLAMTVALISWSMLFATLLLGYFVYRYSQTVWPPLGIETVPMLLPNLSLIVVTLSSVTFWFAHKSLNLHNYTQLRRYNWATLVFGLSYMVIQIKLWEKLNELNLLSSSNIFASILHGFTWIHAGHMVCALLTLILAMLFFRRDEKIEKWKNYFSNVSMFWHFLTIVWAVLYFTLFIF